MRAACVLVALVAVVVGVAVAIAPRERAFTDTGACVHVDMNGCRRLTIIDGFILSPLCVFEAVRYYSDPRLLLDPTPRDGR